MNAFIWYMMLDSCLSSIENFISGNMRCVELGLRDGREFAEMTVLLRELHQRGCADSMVVKFLNGYIIYRDTTSWDFLLYGSRPEWLKGSDNLPWGVMFADVISVVWK